MSDAADLMEAVLGPSVSVAEAQAALGQSLVAEVDPLHWCATHFGLTEAQATHRAAAWLGLPFRETVPSIELDAVPLRLEHLSEVRLVRVAGGSQAIAAPDFFGVLRLKRALRDDPTLDRRLVIVPRSVLSGFMVSAAGEPLMDHARQALARRWPMAAAQLDLTRPIRWGFAAFLVVLAVLVLAAPLSGQLWLVPFWLMFMALPTAMRVWALATPAIPVSRRAPSLEDTALPLYTVLLPLRDEANMVDQLCSALTRLDYPRDKLQAIFIVESRSPETVAAVRRHLGDARMTLVVVPDAAPRTKPKALNFVLPLCLGEFVVVYDAEDRPAPDQLRSIVARFRQNARLECIQARLVIDNGHQGMLPALFTGEYAGLFAVTLPALAQWGAVIPLGGTSNHFRVDTLRQLGGWDAFNVTEDADLGVRLARRGMRVETSTTYTLENAPVSLRAWLGQRTRWMKGWMQTFAVHNRRPRLLLADLGWRRLVLFELTILCMLLAPLLHIAFMPLALWLYFGGGFELTPWLFACLVILVLGQGVAILTNLVGLARTGQDRFWPQQLALPIYWLLVAWATIRALGDFVRRPFHWFKTPHETSVPEPEPVPKRASAQPAE